MRRKYHLPFESDEPSSPIAALIDVAFLMLIFFIVTSTLLKKESDLGLRLPGPGETCHLPGLAVRLQVDDDGTVEVGEGRHLELVEMAGTGQIGDRLRERLELAVVAAGREPLPVILDASDEASHQRVIAVLDCLAGLGIDQVSLVEH